MTVSFRDAWSALLLALPLGCSVAMLACGSAHAAPAHAAPTPVAPVHASPAAGAPAVAGSDGALCEAAIQNAERNSRLPLRLLGAIGIVESGRIDPRTSRVVPWPWSINVAGDDHVFETKAAAIAAVQAARAAGVQSIDVGCMQINLMYHPAAFASLDDAFDPQANAVYAAGFLNRLFIQTGDWRKAAAAYHSQTPGVSEAYAQRVVASWPLAARYGVANPPPGSASGESGSPLERSHPQDSLARYAPGAMPELQGRLAEQQTQQRKWVAMGMLPVPVRPSLAHSSPAHSLLAHAPPAPAKPLRASLAETMRLAALHTGPGI